MSPQGCLKWIRVRWTSIQRMGILAACPALVHSAQPVRMVLITQSRDRQVRALWCINIPVSGACSYPLLFALLVFLASYYSVNGLVRCAVGNAPFWF